MPGERDSARPGTQGQRLRPFPLTLGPGYSASRNSGMTSSGCTEFRLRPAGSDTYAPGGGCGPEGRPVPRQPMSLSVSVPARSDNLRGILAMLAAMGSLIVNDVFIKVAAAELPTGETIFLRGLFTTLLGVGAIAATIGLSTLRLAAAPRMPVRAGAEVAATILYLSALTRMPIADATALLQFTPLAITAGAALFLGAPVGWRRWLATVVGLVGVLIIVRPGGAGFNPYSSLALAAIAFVVARVFITSHLRSVVQTIVLRA